MSRPERPLDPSAGPIAEFAAELRKLREEAGSPKYLQMARRTGRSRTALAEAAGGDHLPTWETVAAFVRACGGDERAWLTRWEAARPAVNGHAVRVPASLPSPLPPSALPRSGSSRRRRTARGAALIGVGLALGIGVGLLLPRESPAARPLTARPEETVIGAGPGAVRNVAFSPMPSFAAGDLLTSTTSGTVRIWDSAAGRLRDELNVGETGAVSASFASLDRNTLVTAGPAGVLRLWNTVDGGSVYNTLCQAPGSEVVLASDPRSRGVVATGGAPDGVVRLWDTIAKQPLRRIRAGARVTTLSFDPRDDGVLATAAGRDVRVWDSHTGELLATLDEVPGPVTALAFDPLTKNTLAVAVRGGPAGIWDAATGRRVRTLRGSADVTGLAFSPGLRNSLAAGDSAGSLRIWDSSTGFPAHDFRLRGPRVTTVAYAADGRRLAEGRPDGSVVIHAVHDW